MYDADVFFLLSKILDLLLAPLTWSVLLVLLGRFGRTERTRRVAPVLGVSLLLVFSLDPVANALWRIAEPPPRPLPAGTTYDAVVLLGGLVEPWATEDSGQRSYNENAERLLATFELLRAGRARTAILSGGKTDPRDSVIEARVLRDQLVAFGVDPSRLVVEGRSRNTRENAMGTKAIAERLGLRRLLVVTSAFHAERARASFRSAGLVVDVYPVDYRSYDPWEHAPRLAPRASHLADSTSALRELAGRIVYRIAGFASGGGA